MKLTGNVAAKLTNSSSAAAKAKADKTELTDCRAPKCVQLHSMIACWLSAAELTE